MKKFLSLAVMLSCLYLPIQALAKRPIELSFQSHYPPASAQYNQVDKVWSAAVGEKSNGSLIINLFSVDAVVKGSETIEGIKKGVLDISYWDNFSQQKKTPYSTLFSLPFLFKNATHGQKLLMAAYNEIPELKAEIDSTGVFLTGWSSALYGISSMEPIRSPADLKGKRVLFTNTEAGNLVKEWGGIPVFVTAADTYVGLQRGMGQAYIGAIPYQKSLRLFEVAKYLTVLPSSGAALYISINKEVFESLSDEHKNILTETAATAGPAFAKCLDDDVNAAQDLYRGAGATVINLSPEELAVFSAAAEDMLAEKWGERLVNNGVKGDPLAWMDRMYKLSDRVLKESTAK